MSLFRDEEEVSKDTVVIWDNIQGIPDYILHPPPPTFNIPEEWNVFAWTAEEWRLFDSDQSNVLTLSWNENDTVDRALKFQVNGGDVVLDMQDGTNVFASDTTVKSALTNSPILTVENTNADDTAGSLILKKTSASPADNDLIGRIDFDGLDDASGATNYARIQTRAFDVSAGSEDTLLTISGQLAGSLTEIMRFSPNGFTIRDTAGIDAISGLATFGYKEHSVANYALAQSSARATFIKSASGQTIGFYPSNSLSATFTTAGNFDLLGNQINNVSQLDNGGNDIILGDDFVADNANVYIQLYRGGRFVYNADDGGDNYTTASGDDYSFYRQGAQKMRLDEGVTFFADVSLNNANSITQAVNGTFSGTVQAGILSDGTATITGGHATVSTVRTGVGSAGAPSHTFGSDLDTGFYRNGADNLAISTAGVARANFSATSLWLSTNIDLNGNNLTEVGELNNGGSPISMVADLDFGSTYDITNIVDITGSGTLSFGTLSATTITDTVMTITAGSLSSVVNITASGSISSGSFTDGGSTWTGGDLTNFGTINCATLNATNINAFTLAGDITSAGYDIVVPTNTADAFTIKDNASPTAVNFIRIDSTTATPRVEILQDMDMSGNNILAPDATASALVIRDDSGTPADFIRIDTLANVVDILQNMDMNSRNISNVPQIDNGSSGITFPSDDLDLNGNGLSNVLGISGFAGALSITGNTTINGDLDMVANDIFQDDNAKHYFGTGNDVDMYHDGTDMLIHTDLVAASDLKIDCGTDKTIELTEEVYDDIRNPVTAIRLAGAQPPTETAYKGGIVYAFPSNANKTLYFNVQLPHKYEEGQDIEFHIHYAIPVAGAGGGAENVKWDLTYSWSNINAAIPAESTASATIDVQSLSADTHYRGQIVGTITGTSKNISSMLICSLTRDVSVANDYASSAYLMEVDFHVPMNTIGSRQPGTK
jgi:hypothetical protein